jgi:hypothetical protein
MHGARGVPEGYLFDVWQQSLFLLVAVLNVLLLVAAFVLKEKY